MAEEVRHPSGLRLVEVTDERSALADRALQLIQDAFSTDERQPPSEIRMEIEEKRLRLLTSLDFHLLALVDEDGDPAAVASGVYLESVNAGFVSYLVVRGEFRSQRIGVWLRDRLVEAFRSSSRSSEWDELAFVLGEVRADSPWLEYLLRSGRVVPFEIDYVQPRITPETMPIPLVLYREPIGDHRRELPVETVRRILYAIYRRAYRIGYPLARTSFRRMLAQLEETAAR